MRKRKGMAWVFLSALATLLIVSLYYTIFSQVYVVNVFPIFNETLSSYPETQDTLNGLITAWNVWPLIVVLGLVFWIFARTQKREYDTGTF